MSYQQEIAGAYFSGAPCTRPNTFHESAAATATAQSVDLTNTLRMLRNVQFALRRIPRDKLDKLVTDEDVSVRCKFAQRHDIEALYQVYASLPYLNF